ncbi:MAG TPA: hypothetical protein VFX16_31735 [Pseudonocardiaceae bacterium]|nr:hypothetical protein [Pseudonocardiaceae bacterium]
MANPALLEVLAREQHAELHRAPAVRRMRLSQNRAGPRQRLGWLLIEIGLRLAVQPA